jgi:hypothetical protein
MTTKNNKGGINQALVQFHANCPTIPMNGVNPYHRSRYARLEDILKVITKPLTDAGLVIIHRPEGTNTMSTEIRHAASGETITTTYDLIINGITKRDGTVEPPGPQQWSSAITYAKRVSISCLLNLCLDSDDDAEAAQNRQQEPASNPAPQNTPAPQNSYQKPASAPDGNEKRWLNKGRELEEIKKALVEGRMGVSELYDEFKISKKLKAELQDLERQGRENEQNRKHTEQQRQDDGLDIF